MERFYDYLKYSKNKIRGYNECDGLCEEDRKMVDNLEDFKGIVKWGNYKLRGIEYEKEFIFIVVED